jgi:hypothetical protein
MMENLKKLNEIRIIANTIQKNELFKKQYINIVTPILDKYKRHICSDDEMYNEIKNAIKKIGRIAVDCQYIPNKCKKPDFSEHGILMEIEMLCKELVEESIYNSILNKRS